MSVSINGVEIVRGLPMAIDMGRPIYARVKSVDGGRVALVTPGGSVVASGMMWLDLLDAGGMARLRELESLYRGDYGGHLTADERAYEPPVRAPRQE